MMRERLLAKARDLIAARLEQAQVRRGSGVVVRNLGDRNTISVEPELLGSPDTLARKRYLAGELVFRGNDVLVAPFLVRTSDPCDPSFASGQPVTDFDPSFPFRIPTVGGTPLDASTPPTLSAASSGVAYLKTTYLWGQTPGTSEEDPAQIYFYLTNAQVVSYPLAIDPPYSVLTAYLDNTDPEFPNYVLSGSVTTAHVMIGWWENGRRVTQYNLGTEHVDFGVSLESSPTSVNNSRVIGAVGPYAYINRGA
jgi:hypothetical protein